MTGLIEAVNGALDLFARVVLELTGRGETP